MLERPYTNRGEYRTYHTLRELQQQHPDDQMTIYANLFIETEDDVPNRQVDHLMTSTRGIFLLETKYWHGTIYHEVTKAQLRQECADYWPLISATFPPALAHVSDTQPFTIVAKPGELPEYHLHAADPAFQADHSRVALQHVLQKTVPDLPFTYDFVLYAYPHSADNRVIDLNHRLNQPTSKPPFDGFSSLPTFARFYENLPSAIIDAARLTRINEAIRRDVLLAD